MTRLLALFLAASMILMAEPVVTGTQDARAQSNDNANTPLGSRIRRSRPFPTEPRTIFQQRELTEVQRRRSEGMVEIFASCLWDRSNEDALDLLSRTDFGFQSFEQIGISNGDIHEHYPIRTCLERVSRARNTGVRLSYTAESMRRWYLREAYMEDYGDGPTWFQPGLRLDEREYPLSADSQGVIVAMTFADCVLLEDPHAADFYFRTGEGSEDEQAAIQRLMPAMSACLPQGQELDISTFTMRVWMGEALWHAANNNFVAPAENSEDEL